MPIQATALLPTLAASPLLPCTLHSLSLAWDFPFTYGSTDSAQGNDPAPPDSSAIPGFHDMRGALVGRCPGLRYIFLDGYHFLFVWWTDEGWEASAQSFGELLFYLVWVGGAGLTCVVLCCRRGGGTEGAAFRTQV